MPATSDNKKDQNAKKAGGKSKERRRTSVGTAAVELADLGVDAFLTIHKNIGRNKPVAFFFLFTLFVIAFMLHQYYLVQRHGYTPTEYSSEAISRLFSTCGVFVAVALFGFILLTCRISSLLLGILYMFMVVFVMSYGTLALSRAVFSLVKDDFSSCVRQLSSDVINERNKTIKIKEVFYDKAQIEHKCCGWGTDVLESWPSIYINSSGLIDSCCIKKIKDCAQNTIRTKASMSGHTIIVSEARLLVPQTIRLYGKKYKWDRYNHFFKSEAELNRERLEPTDVLTSEIMNSSEAIKILSQVNPKKTHPGVFDLQKISAFKKRLNRRRLRKIDYTQTESGTHVGITHFWEVDQKDLFIDFHFRRRMLYLSKGLIEGIIFQDYIFHKRCEKIDPNSEEMDYVDVPRLELAYPKYDFFIGLIRVRMEYIIGMSACAIIMIVILAAFFWSFFSKMKGEEIANLAPPGDFDLLNLQLPNFNELNEREVKRRRRAAKRKQAEIAAKKERAHLAAALKLAHIFNEQTDGGGDGTGDGNPANWRKPKDLTRKRVKGRPRRRDNAEGRAQRKSSKEKSDRRIRKPGLSDKQKNDLDSIAGGRVKKQKDKKPQKPRKKNAVAPASKTKND